MFQNRGGISVSACAEFRVSSGSMRRVFRYTCADGGGHVRGFPFLLARHFKLFPLGVFAARIHTTSTACNSGHIQPRPHHAFVAIWPMMVLVDLLRLPAARARDGLTRRGRSTPFAPVAPIRRLADLACCHNYTNYTCSLTNFLENFEYSLIRLKRPPITQAIHIIHLTN